MKLQSILALLRKDLLIFFRDKRALIITLVLPIILAAFMGYIFGGSGEERETSAISIVLVDEDQSPLSKKLLQKIEEDSSVSVTYTGKEEAREIVQRGDAAVAVLLSKDFGEQIKKAFFRGENHPTIDIWYDPSHGPERAMIQGILAQHIMENVSQEMFSGSSGLDAIQESLLEIENINPESFSRPNEKQVLTEFLQSWLQLQKSQSNKGSAPTTQAAFQGLSIPYKIEEEAITSGDDVSFNGYAHAFIGMGVQFVLFLSIEIGAALLDDKQRGLWTRFRASPLSKGSLLVSKAISGALMALLLFFVLFSVGMLFFQLQIAGSWIGFLLILLSSAFFASCFGLFLAAVGKTTQAMRGIATFAVLVMLMLGGAWVPSFLFPSWIQDLMMIVPTSWSIQGLEAMSWRGLGLETGILHASVIFGFALLFAVIAFWRFPWRSEA